VKRAAADKVTFYEQRINQFQQQVKTLDKIITNYAVARIIVAVVFIGFVYLGFTHSFFFFAIPILLAVFFYLVKAQLVKQQERSIAKHLINLNQWEVDAHSFQYKNFPQGDRFINPQHTFSHDLDLFGEGSLFQYLNRCSTQLGEDMLATNLTEPNFNKDEVTQRQDAIRELAEKIEFRQYCWATGKQPQESQIKFESLYAWLKEPTLVYGKKVFVIAKWLLPVTTCLSLMAISINSNFQSVFVVLFFAQLAIAGAYNKPISQLQVKLSRYRSELENYANIFRLMKEQSFNSIIMSNHQQLAHEATTSVKKFSLLVNSLESRMNLIARVFGNGLFLYDLHSVSNVERWRHQYATQLPLWLSSLAEWDSLLSFAALHYNQPDYAFAEIVEHLSISATDLGHPLIPSTYRVTNSFELGKPAGVLLITGANMAGKSTFLRAIGVNYILAINGSPVCATNWRCPLVELRTGMRTSDSLQENQSYFFAELNRLQSIIQALRNGKPMLILLDEILKGTNSTDKQTGSRELIKQLMLQQALVVIATHDIALGDMEQQYPDKVANACFEGKIENDQLTFDYTLNKGIAQKANATFLMRKMGIIP
jgi:ABC-type multidrug transport system fused ATPase/permease subunit